VLLPKLTSTQITSVCVAAQIDQHTDHICLCCCPNYAAHRSHVFVLLPKLTSTQITSVWCHDLYRLSSDVSCIYLVNGEISSICKVKVQCTLVHALRLCTGRTANRGSRNVALLFFDRGTRRGWGVSSTPRPLFTSGKRPGTHCTGGWVGPRAGLDRCGKSRPHQVSIPGPSSP